MVFQPWNSLHFAHWVLRSRAERFLRSPESWTWRSKLMHSETWHKHCLFGITINTESNEQHAAVPDEPAMGESRWDWDWRKDRPVTRPSHGPPSGSSGGVGGFLSIQPNPCLQLFLRTSLEFLPAEWQQDI